MKPSDSDSEGLLHRGSKDYGTVGPSTSSSGSTGGGDVKPSQPPPLTWHTYLFTLTIAFSGMNLGYDIGITGGLSMLMSKEMHWSEWQTEMFIGSINILAIFGAFFTACSSDVFGRRGIFFVACFCILCGATTTACANSWPMAMVGRFWVGLGVGFSLTVDTMYISEIAPPEHRGFLCNLSEVAINVGIFAATVTNYILEAQDFEGTNHWRIAAATCAFWPLVLLITAYCVLPESPRWLIMHGRTEDAQGILQLTLGEGRDVDETVDNIRQHVEEEIKFAQEGWTPILHPSPALRYMLLAGIGMSVAQQLTGLDSFVYYSPYMFQNAGIQGRQQVFGLTCTLGLVKLMFVFLATFSVDTWGRRPLVLWSSAGIFFSLVGISVCSGLQHISPHSFDASNYGQLAFMFTFMASFSCGMGPICRLIPELFPNRIRVNAMSLAMAANRFTGAVMSTSPLTLTRLVGVTGFFSILAGLALASWIYLYFLFPESKGLTLEEIEDKANERCESSSHREVLPRA